MKIESRGGTRPGNIPEAAYCAQADDSDRKGVYQTLKKVVTLRYIQLSTTGRSGWVRENDQRQWPVEVYREPVKVKGNSARLTARGTLAPLDAGVEPPSAVSKPQL